jgi:hypothetical protein
MGKIVRLASNSKAGLIKWIEDNFDDIDEYLVTFSMNDNTTMTVYDCYSYRSALGIGLLSLDTIQKLQDDFVCKEQYLDNLEKENYKLKNEMYELIKDRNELSVVKEERDMYENDYKSCFEDLVKLQRKIRGLSDLISDIKSCFCHDDSLNCKNIQNTIDKYELSRN